MFVFALTLTGWSDITYYGARYYDPKRARFISPDPARDGLNLYADVGNNPLNYPDPTGKFRFSEEIENRLEENSPGLYEKNPLRYHVKALKAHSNDDSKKYGGVVFDSRISPGSRMDLSLRRGRKSFFSNMETILENPNVEVHFTANDFFVPKDMGAALAGKSSRTDFEYADIVRIVQEDPTPADRFCFYLNFGEGE